jgi:hypothetical protein
MAEDKKDIPVTNEGMGQPLSAKNQVLTAGAAVTQVSCHECLKSFSSFDGRSFDL